MSKEIIEINPEDMVGSGKSYIPVGTVDHNGETIEYGIFVSDKFGKGVYGGKVGLLILAKGICTRASMKIGSRRYSVMCKRCAKSIQDPRELIGKAWKNVDTIMFAGNTWKSHKEMFRMLGDFDGPFLPIADSKSLEEKPYSEKWATKAEEVKRVLKSEFGYHAIY